MTDPQPSKSDLGVRTASAVVMVAVAGTALWLGGRVWGVFVAAVGLGVLLEWQALVNAISQRALMRIVGFVGGLVYIGIASAILVLLRGRESSEIANVLRVVVPVMAVDIGAYFAGRTFGGPRIAPTISPSKTWAGLIGGMAGASIALAFFLVPGADDGDPGITTRDMIFWSLGLGSLGAIIAQTGVFFESWMKRRAGVKDSGSLIPGHGGLFDRVDGLLAVCFVLGIVPLSFYLYDIARLGYFPE
jgi:phosphatidate cytidylyltransferase